MAENDEATLKRPIVQLKGKATSLVCGADGCRNGWIVVSLDTETRVVTWRNARTVTELIHGQPVPELIAIDIPIGLPDVGRRECDHEARTRLRRPRASSVFPAPIRPVLAAGNYGEACRIMHRAEGKGMTRQSWSIVGKVREVDDVLRRAPELQTRVREVHPEVSFWCLAGEPMQHRKRSRPGHEERFELLKPLFGHRLQEVLDEVHDKLMRRDCGDDDLLDAFAALWTAERVAAGTSLTLPRHPALDSAGLRMEIVA